MLDSDLNWLDSGNNFGFSAFLNNKFLGSNQGAGHDLTNNTFALSAANLNAGDNVVTVLLDSTGEKKKTLSTTASQD